MCSRTIFNCRKCSCNVWNELLVVYVRWESFGAVGDIFQPNLQFWCSGYRYSSPGIDTCIKTQTSYCRPLEAYRYYTKGIGTGPRVSVLTLSIGTRLD
ncbi:hypothetical protein V6N13_004820 [Hibiscus sabdariffa]